MGEFEEAGRSQILLLCPLVRFRRVGRDYLSDVPDHWAELVDDGYKGYLK